MKTLLITLCVGTTAAMAAPLVTGALSASGQAAVASYTAVEVCMSEMATILSRIQDKPAAATESAALLRVGKELKTLLENMDDPYAMGAKAVTTTDAYTLRACAQRMRVAGMAVQNHMVRLAKVQFYNSAELIKALQELEMLDDATDSLIR